MGSSGPRLIASWDGQTSDETIPNIIKPQKAKGVIVTGWRTATSDGTVHAALLINNGAGFNIGYAKTPTVSVDFAADLTYAITYHPQPGLAADYNATSMNELIQCVIPPRIAFKLDITGSTGMSVDFYLHWLY